MLCKNCLVEIKRSFSEDDQKLLSALNDKGVLNKETASQVTKLTTSKLRDTISRLKGATLIEETKIGNNILLRLSESGREITKISFELNQRGG